MVSICLYFTIKLFKQLITSYLSKRLISSHFQLPSRREGLGVGSLFHFIHYCNEEAEGDEGTRRQDEEQDVVRLGQQRQSEDGTGAEEFATDAE